MKTFHNTDFVTINDFKQRIIDIYEQQSHAFKLSIQFSFITEAYKEDEEGKGSFTYLNYNSYNKFFIEAELVSNRESLDAILQYNFKKEAMYEYCKNLPKKSFNIRVIGIYDMVVKIMELQTFLRGGATMIQLPDFISNDKNIIGMTTSVYNMCFWNCMAYHEIKKRYCMTRGKELFEQYYNKKPDEIYQGLEIDEIDKVEQHFNIGINVLQYNEKQILEYERKSKITNGMHLLLFKNHFCYIKNLIIADKSNYMCQTCGHCFRDNCDLRRHVAYCDNYKKEDKFDLYPRVYEPEKNLIVQLNEIFDTNFDIQYDYTITYDFESMVQKMEIDIGAKKPNGSLGVTLPQSKSNKINTDETNT